MGLELGEVGVRVEREELVDVRVEGDRVGCHSSKKMRRWDIGDKGCKERLK